MNQEKSNIQKHILDFSKRHQNAFSIKKNSKKIKPLDIANFFYELALLLETNISITNALNLICTHHENLNLKKLLLMIKQAVESGSPLGEAFQRQSKQFNPITIHLIIVGECSGTLPDCLRQAAIYLEQNHNFKTELKKNLSYPLFLMLFSIIMIAVTFTLVIPEFQSLFESFKTELPWLTLLVIKVVQNIKSSTTPLFYLLISLLTGIYFFKEKSRSFAILLGKFYLKIPVVGLIIQNHTVSRVCYLFEITHSANIRFPDALLLISNSITNPAYSQEFLKIASKIKSGKSLCEALSYNSLFFPQKMVEMIHIGEKSGSLGQILKKTGDHYQKRVEYALKLAIQWLEPITMVFIGLSIGILVIAMYLPIFQLGSLF